MLAVSAAPGEMAQVTLRMNDNFTVAMLIEVMNAFAKLDTLVPRLRSAALRELGPLLPDLSKDQCIACTPVMVLTLPDAPLGPLFVKPPQRGPVSSHTD